MLCIGFKNIVRRRTERSKEMDIPKMVGLSEASRQTGLSYDFIRKLCLQNKIVYVRAGVKYLVNLEKLVEYLNQGEQSVMAAVMGNCAGANEGGV